MPHAPRLRRGPSPFTRGLLPDAPEEPGYFVSNASYAEWLALMRTLPIA
jgi:hypothetical protein